MIYRTFFMLLFVFGASLTPVAADTTQSETRLRALLVQTPEHDRAREALAVLLMKSGRTDAAAFHAGYLARSARDPKLRQDAEALRARIDGPRWGWRPIFSLTPSSNLNKASTEAVIYVGDTPFAIDADSRAKDGVGLTFGAAVWVAPRVTETWRAHLSGQASATVYDTDDLETQQNVRTSASLSRRIGPVSLTFGLSADATATKGDLERRRAGPFTAVNWRLWPNRSFDARFETQSVTYLETPFRSGRTSRLTFGWTEVVAPDLTLRFGLPLETVRTERAHLDYDGRGLSVAADKLWLDGALRTSFGVAWSDDRYKGAFPGTSTARRDRVTTVTLELSHAKWAFRGFRPTLRIEHSRARSNVSLYEYKSTDAQVIFRRSF